MRKWSNQHVFTYIALVVLLVVRFPIGDFASNLRQLFNIATLTSWIEVLRLIQNWTFYSWERFAFILVGIVILVNRSNLKKINIDRGFLVLFSIGGLLFCVYYFWPLGWMGVLLSGYIMYLLSKNEFNFENDSRPNSYLLIIILGFAFYLYWLSKIGFIGRPSIQSFYNYFHRFSTELPFWLIEEVIFRGLLWGFMQELRWADLVIIIVQSLLFWIFHVYYMFSDPIYFWLVMPIFSVLLGILVWKYKSITPSSIAHILFNLR